MVIMGNNFFSFFFGAHNTRLPLQAVGEDPKVRPLAEG